VATGHSSAANRIRPIDNGLDLGEGQLGGTVAATYASAMTPAARFNLNLVPCRNASVWCRTHTMRENLRRALAPTLFRPFVTSGLGGGEEQGELPLAALRGSLVEKSKN